MERNAAIQQGVILRHIRDTGLYREKHATFADYCEKDLGYTRDWAYKRIDLADTVQQMSAIADIPQIAKESQARAIKPVLRDHGYGRDVNNWRHRRPGGAECPLQPRRAACDARKRDGGVDGMGGGSDPC